MSIDSVYYQLNDLSVSPKRLVAYYDFSPENVDVVGVSGEYRAYIKNLASGGVLHSGEIVGIEESSETGAQFKATGSGGFVSSEGGELSKNSVKILQSSGIDLKKHSFIFLTKSNLNGAGVLMGSLQKFGNIGDPNYYARGFNLGYTDRGQVFFQGSNSLGDFSFVQNDEPTYRRINSIHFDGPKAVVSRVNLTNNKVNSQEFAVDVSQLYDADNLYLGSSPNFYLGGAGDPMFSGQIERALIVSGKLSAQSVVLLGRAMLSEYYLDSGSITTGQVFSGYDLETVYQTGITGYTSTITGYKTISSGSSVFSGEMVFTGMVEFGSGEGQRKMIAKDGYFEEESILLDVCKHTYNPFPNTAQGTLGLQDGSVDPVSGFIFSGSYVTPTIEIPLYEISTLTGVTNKVSVVTQAPVYTEVVTTGASNSGINFSDNLTGFTKNTIYYLGSR